MQSNLSDNSRINSNTILFTGGGSSGHVTPNLAIIKQCQDNGWNVFYIGSYQGIEKDIISRTPVPYKAIATAKLRRHLSWQNLLTPFRVLQGINQAYWYCRSLKPKVVFSKGGFVAFPVVIGAWLNRIPVIAHESDVTPGLANRLSFPFAKYICVTFKESVKYFNSSQKIIITGTPIRAELFEGNADKGLALCHFNKEKPVLLITGGGLGSDAINVAIRKILPKLLTQYQIIHLCGKGKTDPAFDNLNGYKQFEYLNEELADIFACTDCVVSRAGANTLYELLALRKPHLLIPLSKKASRGDQLINAKIFAEQGYSEVVNEEEIQNDDVLLTAIQKVFQDQNEISHKLNQYQLPNSLEIIYGLINQATQKLLEK